MGRTMVAAGRPGGQVPGVLRYEPENGLTLSLIGAFEVALCRRSPLASSRSMKEHAHGT